MAKSAYERALKEQRSADVAYARLMLLGSAGTGKTCLKRSLMEEPFNPHTTSTIVSDVSSVRPFGHEWQTMRGKKWREATEEDEIEELSHLFESILSRPSHHASVLSSQYSHDESASTCSTAPDLNVEICIKSILERASSIDQKTESLVQPFLHIWDCGGQPVFLEILSAFLTPRTMFLLLFDASKDFKEKWQSRQNTPDGKVLFGEVVNESTSDLMAKWMATIHSHLMKHNRDDTSSPSLYCIGTRGDKLNSESKEKVKQQIQTLYEEKEFSDLIKDVLIIDNTTSGKGENEDPSITELRGAIDSFINTLVIPTPVNWVLFRKVLQELKQNVISVSDAIAIGVACHIPADDVPEVLKFYHELGAVLYYPQIKGLRNKVIINPKWFVDTIGKVFTLEGFKERSSTTQMWLLLQNYGILVQPLYHEVWQSSGIDPQEIIELLVHFRLAAQVQAELHGYSRFKQYFLPAVLPGYTGDPNEVRPGYELRASPVHITFTTGHGYVPPGFFTRLATAVATDANVRFNFKSLYRNCVCLSYNHPTDDFVLTDVNEAIQVDVLRYVPESSHPVPFKSVCQKILKLLDECCQMVEDALYHNGNSVDRSARRMQYVCQCSPSSEVHYIEDIDAEKQTCNCNIQKRPRPLTNNESMWNLSQEKHKETPHSEEINNDDTSAGIEAHEFDREKIEKWLEEGEVELKVTRINMHGAPGAGKTCSQHLLLNEPLPAPPDELTDSTSIACRAVQATRISIDDKNKKWQRVDIEDLLNQLASTKVDIAPKPEDDVPAHSDKPSLEKTPKTEPIKNQPTKNQSPENKPTEIESLILNELIDLTENVQTESSPIENEQAENKTTKSQLTKKKPAKNKPTNTELVKKMLQAFKEGKSKKLSTNWVYFIDSGGQPAYREVLPLFTRAAALNIITIDLTKGIDEKCKFQYRVSQHRSLIDTNRQYSNRDMICSTISSGAMLSPVKFPYVTGMPDHPHYLILGTRIDDESVTEEKLKDMNESLKEYKANKKVIPHNKHKGSIIFPVNTLLPAGSKEREKASVDLCTTISSFGVAMTIQLPIQLFAFEIALQLEAEKKKRSFLTREEVIEIGESLQLDKESDINEALQYLHNVTIILYYREIETLKDLIFVDPEPILDVLSRLIAITYVDHDKLQQIANPPPSIDERRTLTDYGLFKENLLTNIGGQIFNKDFNSSHMIKLLIHLHIIAKVENREEGDYFFPCVLPSYDKLNPAPTEIQPLLIAWEINNNSSTKTLAIPQGLFPLTIVRLLEKKDIEFAPDPDPDPEKTKFYRYNDAMSLRVYIKSEEYTIDIINRYTHIELRFYDCKEFCSQIRELVTDAIKESSDDLKVSKNHILAFKCPSENEQCYCIVQNKSSTRCTQCRSHCKVLQGDDDSYRCWFSDSQSSSPGTEASTESPPTKRPTVQPTGLLLDTSNLIDVLDVLGDHGYSGVSYYKLGLRLGLLHSTLDVIKENNKGDVEGCLTKCLTAWLEQRDNVRSVGVPTYGTLIKALRRMGKNAVADGIDRDINSGVAEVGPEGAWALPSKWPYNYIHCNCDP